MNTGAVAENIYPGFFAISGNGSIPLEDCPNFYPRKILLTSSVTLYAEGNLCSL
jgi:hypothetical protein